MFKIENHLVILSLLVFVVKTVHLLEVENVEKLEKLNIELHPMTVSGFSSGATMAQQLHISSSRRFDGVGLFSSVFYSCTGDTKNKSFCFDGSRTADDGISDAVNYENRGLIDSLSNLQNHNIFFWFGILDENRPGLSARLGIITFYQNFISSPERIYTKLQSAYHLLPTNSVSQPCTTPASNAEFPFLGNCNYSGSYESLTHLIGPSITLPEPNITLQPLRLFDQSEFFGKFKSDEIGLDESGFLYVPTKCDGTQETKCLLHIFLHGCNSQREKVNSTFIEKSGFLEVAEANNIVMLFPQTISIPEHNPRGCWDYEGFTGDYYETKKWSTNCRYKQNGGPSRTWFRTSKRRK